MLSPNQVHVDQALGNVAIAYQNPAFVFQAEVFPIVPVDQQSNVYFKFSKQHFRSYPDAKRPGADVNEIPVDLDARGIYFCDGHALDYPQPDEISANADPGADLDIETTQKVTEAVRLNEEINGAGIVTSTSNITQNTTLSGTSQWSDFVNSDPFLVVDQKKTTIEQATGLIPNRLLISRYTFLTLRNHPKLLDRVKYTGGGLRTALTAEQLAEAFDVEKVVIAAGLKQSNPEGRADSLTYAWGKDALLYYKAPRPGKRIATLGYTFVWMVSIGANGRMQGNLEQSAGGFLVRRYRWERRRSDVIGVEYYYDQRLIEPNAGYLWKAAVA